MAPNRSNRRGSALGAALLFVVLVGIAGTSLLSISSIHQLDMVRSSYDVRLLVAAEAGLETIKGRFVLIEDVQDDWSALFPLPGAWNQIGGTMTINGLSVQCEALFTGTPSVPRARIRAIASGWNRTRVVEYEIRIPNFGDFALYSRSSNTWGPSANTKVQGNVYWQSGINLGNNPGIEFFGEVTSANNIWNYPDAPYNFKLGFEAFHEAIDFPEITKARSEMLAAALTTGRVFWGNTISIQFVATAANPNSFIRTYVRKTGAGAYATITAPAEVLPDESVIYINFAAPPAGIDSDVGGTFAQNKALSNNDPVGLWGTLGHPGQPSLGRRVTVASERSIQFNDRISYVTLLENRDLRRMANKTSAAALGFREMLGVVCDDDLRFDSGNWTKLAPTEMVTDIAGDTGHLANQYNLDGVYLSRTKAQMGGGTLTGRELWLNGGLIYGTQTQQPSLFESTYDRKNWDTDYRLLSTMPPFFLRSYNSEVTVVRGTWRTYEKP
jgi:hypothetical protein